MRGEAVFGSGNPNEDGAVCFPEAVQWYNGIRQRIRELSFPRKFGNTISAGLEHSAHWPAVCTSRAVG